MKKIICNDDLILSARLIPECVLICHDNLSFWLTLIVTF